MAINVSFNGATIYKPGAYSKTEIDLGGGFPLSPTGIVAIFGEAEAGTPGTDEVNIANNVFAPDQMQAIRAKYRKGPIVDACNFLFAPGADGAIPGGAQAIYIYKTNASTKAELALSAAKVQAREWGIGGNTITTKITTVAESGPRVDGALLDLTATAIPANLSVTMIEDGKAPNTFVTTATHSTISSFIADIANDANWTLGYVPVNYGLYPAGTDAAVRFTVRNSDAANSHQRGFGKSIELVEEVGGLCEFMGIQQGIHYSQSEATQVVKVRQNRDNLTEEAAIGGNIVLTARYLGAEDEATLEVQATKIVVTTGTDVREFDKEAYNTLEQLVTALSLIPGWTVRLTSVAYNNLPLQALDQVVVHAKTEEADAWPARVKKDAWETKEFFANSNIVELTDDMLTAGLLDAQLETALGGGTKGGTNTAQITEALAKFEKMRVNAVVPLMSRDAAEDIMDNLTDAASNYTIEGIHQAVKTHLSLTATTKKKSERQGYLSIKSTYADAKVAIATMADARIQMCIQDIRQADSTGAMRWFQPWAAAAMLAGARGGSPVGNPMTFKYFNMSGIRHTAQPMRTPEQNIVVDFDPDTMYDDAIASAVTFWEAPQSGGFRLVVDNTTYNKDANWVYNRAHVLYAADIIAYDFRNQLENIYVGMKNIVSAAEIKSTCESILGTYLAQGMTVSTGDAKNGFKGLIVQVNGNTVNISVTVKLVEGIDFVLADVFLQRAQQTA